MDTLLSLNEAQRQAVTHSGGPLLVIAGAGTGKTRVITHRIAYLIDQGLAAPHQILSITFTNKAAQEMRDRVRALLVEKVAPASLKDMWVSTFHSACLRILRQHAHLLGYPENFSVYATDDQVEAVKHVMSEAKIDPKRHKPKEIAKGISYVKNHMLPQHEWQYYDLGNGLPPSKFADIYHAYHAHLFENGAMDFDDLLLKTDELFAQKNDILQHYQQRFSYVLVDEYQDTNKVQNKLVMQLTEQHRNLFVVGDANQCIYGFRGSDIRNILDLQHHNDDIALLNLTVNYRSEQPILDAANSLICHNEERLGDDLQSYRESEAPQVRAKAVTLENDLEEAELIIRSIQTLHQRGRISTLNECAILYRTNAQAKLLEATLAKHKMPHRVLRGSGLLARAEVRDALAYLRVCQNHSDNASLLRIINKPKRGVGKNTIAKLQQHSLAYGMPMLQVISEANRVQTIPPQSYGELNCLISIIRIRNDPLIKWTEIMLSILLEGSGYLQSLRAERAKALEAGEPTTIIDDRLDNLKLLLDIAKSYTNAPEFTDNMSLLDASDDTTSIGGADIARVNLSTIHGAKGLEFEAVFVVGAEEGLLPHCDPTNTQELEEERRLAYVAMTRAKKYLVLTRAITRMRYGQWESIAQAGLFLKLG